MKIVLDDGQEFELIEIHGSLGMFVYHRHTEEPPLPAFFQCEIKKLSPIQSDIDAGIAPTKNTYWQFTYRGININRRWYAPKAKNLE